MDNRPHSIVSGDLSIAACVVCVVPKQVLDLADIVFAALFTSEMVMKLMAFGGVACGPR